MSPPTNQIRFYSTVEENQNMQTPTLYWAACPKSLTKPPLCNTVQYIPLSLTLLICPEIQLKKVKTAAKKSSKQ